MTIGQVFATLFYSFQEIPKHLKYVVQCFERFPGILYCNFLQLFRFLRATFYCSFYQTLHKM